MADAYLLNISVDYTNLLLCFLRLEVYTRNFTLTKYTMYIARNDITTYFVNDKDKVTKVGKFYNFISSIL